MNNKIFSFLLVCVFLLSACAALPSGSVSTPELTEIATQPAPVVTDPTPAPTHIAVDLTPAQRAAVQFLADQHALAVDQIQLISTEAMAWENGCLGVVLPGKMCTKGPVEGFKLIREANGQKYEIHTNQDGSSVLDAAPLLATTQMVVRAADNTVQVVNLQVVNLNAPLGPTYNPAFTGFFRQGVSLNGSAYVLANDQVVVVDVNGSHTLNNIAPTYGVAVWKGGADKPARLAWGTPVGTSANAYINPSNLIVSSLDGSNQETLMTQELVQTAPVEIVVWGWSGDGQQIYYSLQPIGLGGAIPLVGANSLYRFDIAAKTAAPLVPVAQGEGFRSNGCLDALSLDNRYAAEHCTPNMITIMDLATGGHTSIQPPAEVSSFDVIGGARFSPTGNRLAFALVKGDPTERTGWVAVSDGISGASRVVMTGTAGSDYNVLGWLDDQTLLVQQNDDVCSPTCANQIWMVGLDGSQPVKLAEGTFLTMLDK